MLDWTHSLPSYIRVAAREDLSNSFPPSGIEPEREHTAMLSYLSFTTSGYNPAGDDQSRFFETKAQRTQRLSDTLWPDSDSMPPLEGESDDEQMDEQTRRRHNVRFHSTIPQIAAWLDQNPL